MIIATGSKNRVDGMTALKVFKDPVIAVEPQDFKEYREKHPDKNIIRIADNDKGFGYMLNALVDYTLNVGQKYLLFFDDDIQNVTRKDKKPFICEDFIKEGEKLMKEKGLAQLGVSFSGHNWYEEADLTERNACWGLVFLDAEVIKRIGGYDEKLVLFNDYEITARLLLKQKRVMSWYKYMFHHKMRGAKGGANTFYDQEDLVKKQILYLKGRYGDYVRVIWHSKHKMWEIRFNWRLFKTYK